MAGRTVDVVHVDQAGRTGRLWAIHIEGPDDIIAKPSQALAEQEADAINAFAESVANAPDASPFTPRWRASAVEWPGTAEEHAAELAEAPT